MMGLRGKMVVSGGHEETKMDGSIHEAHVEGTEEEESSA